MENHIKKLVIMDACDEAVDFARKFPTSQAAWDACDRGDWMLWLLGKLAGKPHSASRKKLVLAACKCARLSLKCVPKTEKRPLKAIQTAEAWAKGKKGVSLDDVRAAADAATNAAYAADAPYAAADAAKAAYAAKAAAYTAEAAYAAAKAAAYTAAKAAAYTASRGETLTKCANIVRKYYPTAPRLRKTGGRG